MPRRYVNELKDGESLEEVFLLADKQLRANRNANLYLLASLRDKTGVVSGLMWNVTEELLGHVNAGEYVKVRGKVQLYQGMLQLIIAQISSVNPATVDAADFVRTPGQDVALLIERMREILRGIGDPDLRNLMDCFLIDENFMQSLAMAPAAVKTHHAYQGGLLEHVVNMLEAGQRLGDLYPKVNFDLVLAGIFLHDIGKIREMTCDAGFVYTDEGQLLGHLVIGIEMLDEKIRESEKLSGELFPSETALRLKHMILSHHGTYEFGSPRLPMTPEAIALHHLDNLDAKLHEFTRSIEEDPNTHSSWTPFSPRLERKLFKGGTSKPSEDAR